MAKTPPPPHHLDAERALLGAILVNNTHLDTIAERLKPDQFYLESHRLIYSTMLAMAEKAMAIDMLTLLHELQRVESHGIGAADLATLTDGIPHLVNVTHYLEMIEDAAIRRRLIGTSTKIMNYAVDTVFSAKEVLEEAENQIHQVQDSSTPGTVIPVADIGITALQQVEQLYANRSLITGVPTGFVDLDRMTCGLQPSELIILAGRPASGKTAAAVNIAQFAAGKGVPVAFFSLEMTRVQLVLRMAAAAGWVDSHKMRSGYMSKEDFAKIVTALETLGQLPIGIDDTSTQTVMGIRAKCRRLKQQKGLGLVVIDYLQLIASEPSRDKRSRNENRTQEVGAISRALKALAKDLQLPVLALSQLNRAPERRNDSRPQLSDLRESGSIEAEADLVMALYREELYKPTEENAGIAELHVLKARNGPTGVVKLAFLKSFTKFESLVSGDTSSGD